MFWISDLESQANSAKAFDSGEAKGFPVSNKLVDKVRN